MKLFFSTCSFLIATLSITMNPVFAKSINLYSDPKADAKIVGTLDSDAGIIPIFNPKGDWVKVADPRNGNVGWIKSNELTNSGTTSFTFTEKTISNGKPQAYHVFQFGGPQQLTPEQSQAMMKQMEVQQQMIQKNVQQLMQNMFPAAGGYNFPVIVPVMMVPVANTNPAPTAKTTSPTINKPATGSPQQNNQR